MNPSRAAKKETVLILGNGLSRLAFDAAIRAHDGPVWGCNRVFLDYGDVLTGILGHAEVLEEAHAWGDVQGQTFEILTISAPEIYRKDTGTTLVAEALTRGHDVICVGFDLGGADIYSPGHEKKNKSTWVQRWRLILSQWDPARVTFWGYDHKPFILSNRPAQEYYRKYSRGEAHIPGVDVTKKDYSKVFENIPKMYLRNKSDREWTFHESPELLRPGERIILPEYVAKKYAESYRRELVVEPCGGLA